MLTELNELMQSFFQCGGGPSSTTGTWGLVSSAESAWPPPLRLTDRAPPEVGPSHLRVYSSPGDCCTLKFEITELCVEGA